jgi:multiple sugar transport system permease protein
MQRPQPLTWGRVAANPWVWLAPVLVPFVLFLLLPIVRVVWLSFHEWDWFGLQWVGLAQYRRLLRDPEFWRALGHTLAFAAVVVPGWVALTLVIATLIAPRAERTRSGWMTAFYMTYLVSPVVLAIVWSWMLAPGAEGLLNRLLALLHLGPVPWLTSQHWALASVIFSTLLTIPGSGVVIYTAAIGGLPQELYEAAHLEGASPWGRWWHITVPLLRPTTLYLAVVYSIAAFQVFERVYIMTGGGPGGSTSVLVQQIYTRAFLDFNFGAASAEAVILLLLIAGIAWLQFRVLRSDVEY